MKTGILVIAVLAIGVLIGLYAPIGGDSAPQPNPSPTVTNFEECAAAGNPVMESYPRQCSHEGELFIEEIDEPIMPPANTESEEENATAGAFMCDVNNRPEACTMQYEPVCGSVEVQCFTEPCDPVTQTFGNGCTACSNQNVISYTKGECGNTI